MLFIVLILIIFILKVPNKTIGEPFLVNNRPSIYAHRGAGYDAPENTLHAAKLAKSNGADGIEFDIDFTRDNIAIVIHDETVDRTTNGCGRVSDLTFDQIRKFRALGRDNPDKRDIKIPTLEEMVILCLSLDLKMFIDVKEYKRIDKVIKTINKLYESYPRLYNMAIVCSFYPHMVYLLKIKNNKIMTGLTHRSNFLTRKVDGSDNNTRRARSVIYFYSVMDVILEWCHKTFLWYVCQNHLYLMFQEVVSHEEIAFMKERHIEVIVWTVNNKQCQDYIKNCLHTSYMTDTMDENGIIL